MEITDKAFFMISKVIPFQTYLGKNFLTQHDTAKYVDVCKTQTIF